MSEEIRSEISAEEPHKEMGTLQRIVGVFTSPRETFENVNQKPDWVVPFVIILVAVLAIVLITLPIAMAERLEKQKEVLMERRGMSADEAEEAMAKGAQIGKILAPIAGVAGTAIVLVVVSAILLFGGNVIMGGDSNFKKVFSVYCYTSLIGILGGIIKTPIMLSKETMNVHFSLATFLSEDASENFLYRLLSKVEVFGIWEIVVLSIGLAVIYKFATQKAATLVVVLWLIYVFASAGLAALF